MLVLIQVRRATPSADKHTPHDKEITETETKNSAARGVAAEPLGDHPAHTAALYVSFLRILPVAFVVASDVLFFAFEFQSFVCMKYSLSAFCLMAFGTAFG